MFGRVFWRQVGGWGGDCSQCTSTLWTLDGPAGGSQGQHQLFIVHFVLSLSPAVATLPPVFFQFPSAVVSSESPHTQINRLHFFLSSFHFRTPRDSVFYVNRPPQFSFFPPAVKQANMIQQVGSGKRREGPRRSNEKAA